MTPVRLLTVAAGLSVALLSSAPVLAQGLGINVCGAPPLPPCASDRTRVERRTVIEERGARLGSVCRTRALRCATDEPQAVGSRCVCEDDDEEEVVGRFVR